MHRGREVKNNDVELSPVIQDVEFIGHWGAGLLEIPNGTHNLSVAHVTRWVVIEANRDDSRMVSVSGLHQEMQILEIIVVPCQKNQALPNGIEKVARICRAAQRRVGRNHDMVACLCEPGYEGTLGAIVVEVKIHALAEAVMGA
jgi:hypothetical protein